jgi:small subunit ribosomal protein S7
MRKKRSTGRLRIPDPRYNDVLVSEFINNIMKGGKKHTARRILYDAFALIEERTKNAGIDVFKKAVSNTRPVLEVKARRVGGATISYASGRKDRSMAHKLAAEFIAASNGEGSAVKKKEDTHKMAEANKAFAHYRW